MYICIYTDVYICRYTDVYIYRHTEKKKKNTKEREEECMDLQDGEAVGRWHTAAVAYCRLRAPAADQCLKKNQLTRTQEPSPRADSSWHPDPLY